MFFVYICIISTISCRKSWCFVAQLNGFLMHTKLRFFNQRPKPLCKMGIGVFCDDIFVFQQQYLIAYIIWYISLYKEKHPQWDASLCKIYQLNEIFVDIPFVNIGFSEVSVEIRHFVSKMKYFRDLSFFSINIDFSSFQNIHNCLLSM